MDLQLPATPPQDSEGKVLVLLRQCLVEAEKAYAILRAKGYGKSWMSLDEIAELVPDMQQTPR